MLVIISPAKRLDFDTPTPRAIVPKATQPEFMEDAETLVKTLRDYTPRRLTNLMGISKDLATLNQERYAAWRAPFTPDDAKPAMLAFKGDVYLGLQAGQLGTRDLNWAQKNVRILSGLHGVLRPLDLMQPYRLEMGTALKTGRGKDLYQFWDDRVTHTLNAVLEGRRSKVIVNLASNEYFGVVQPAKLAGRLLNVRFEDLNKGKYKVLSFFAKKARGMMTRYVIDKRISAPRGLLDFDYGGYYYAEAASSDDTLVFRRDGVDAPASA
ncbi:MAG: peroxide stress protein YaaA [Pseudomonadota bacterium]